MKRIAVIGAGVSGLSLAYRLQEAVPDADITVIEQDARSGGTAWTLREQGFQLEIGPNGFLDSKPTTVQLCKDVGLGGELIRASEAAARNRYLFLEGRLHVLPSGPFSFLTSPLLSWRGKLAMIRERWRPRREDDGDESIDAFARRRAGKEAAEVFADALVTGIFAGDPRLLSMRSCFPRVVSLEREHGSVVKGFAAAARQRRREASERGEKYQRSGGMWSFRGGLRRLVETLSERLRRPPVYGILTRRIERDAAARTWVIHGDGRDRWEADALVLACPAHQQAKLLADLDASLAAEMSGIPYNRVAVVGLGYHAAHVPTSLDGFGFIAPQSTRRDLLGVQWCSSIFPDRAPPGFVLLRAMAGGWRRPEVVGWDDATLVSAIRAELRLAMKVTAPPVFHKVIRWQRAIPQYHLGHSERVARIERLAAGHDGLFLAGNAYHGVALNDCVEQGQVVAQRVAAWLAHAR